MLFKFIATLVLAVGTAGLVIFTNKYLFKGKLPNWVLPAAIALAIIGFQVFDEYNWYPRKKASLDENYLIVNEYRAKRLWRPWSYIWPSVTSITVVNRDNLQNLENAEDVYGAMMISTSYLQETRYGNFAFDCARHEFGPYSGDLNQVQWAPMTSEIETQICDGLAG